MAVWKLKDLDSSLVIDLKSGDIFGRSEGHYKFPECSKMSRQHCQFILENNYAFILDLNSRNGTYINSVKADPHTKVLLGNGHILMFGEKTFMIKGGDDATASNRPMIPGIQVETKLAHSAQVQSASPAVPVRTFNFSYKGSLGEMVVLLLKNLIFTVLTLGIYLPYARTNMRKFIWKSTSLNNSPFLYKADPSSMLKSYVIMLVLFLVFNFGFQYLTEIVAKGNVPLGVAFGILNWVILSVFIFKITYGAYAFMVNHTSYRSIKFQVLRAGAREHFRTSLIGTFFAYLTLGLYYPFLSIRLEEIKWKNTLYGNIPFKFKPDRKAYAMLWYKGFLLSIFTLGIYTPWFLISTHQYKLKQLSVGGAKFKSTTSGFGYSMVMSKSFLLVLFTLGLASPFVFNLHLAYFLENLSLTGAIDFDQVLQAQKENASSFDDAASDVMDVDMDFA